VIDQEKSNRFITHYGKCLARPDSRSKNQKADKQYKKMTSGPSYVSRDTGYLDGYTVLATIKIT